ncbi:SGNH/GDSL hydrolase family protein [Marmoricola sp. URHB0036]|uniref:SGNH/GDSL hydrolase family protein n=1 Tax=Marmoricola sp. URHB0036 TaxID=1298863 RepID=UPI0012DC5B04|nr:SGNH/GDSL hydrolase family protein [Marmoricola sp. URHB0036]
MITRLAVLGDSIAWGQGATRERDRLPSRLVDGLAARGYEAEASVFAVPGATSAGLDAQVSRALSWRPDLAVVVIGANDLTHLIPVDVAAKALGDAVRRLRAAGIEVVVAPAPDLSAVPHVPVFLRETVRAAGDLLREHQVSAVLAECGRIADPDQRASRAFATDPSLFSSDRFHPSSAGYAVIADSLLPALIEAVQTRPAKPGD